MSEEWRPVVGYEGYYEVSNLGRVRRMPYVLATNVGKKGSAKDYCRVRLFDDRGGRQRSVHALVAAAFIGPRPTEAHEVNHKDGDPRNNGLENLEYLTKLENMRHSFNVLGRPKPPNGERHNSKTHPETFPRGEAHGRSKLTGQQVRSIRTRYAKGKVSQPALAAEFGVSQKVIWQVVNRVTWAHLK